MLRTFQVKSVAVGICDVSLVFMDQYPRIPCSAQHSFDQLETNYKFSSMFESL